MNLESRHVEGVGDVAVELDVLLVRYLLRFHQPQWLHKVQLVSVEEDRTSDEVAVLLDDIPDPVLIGVLAALGLQVNHNLGAHVDVLAILNLELPGAVA